MQQKVNQVSKKQNSENTVAIKAKKYQNDINNLKEILELQKQIKIIRQTLGLDKEDIVIPVSALKKTGHEELLDLMEDLMKG